MRTDDLVISVLLLVSTLVEPQPDQDPVNNSSEQIAERTIEMTIEVPTDSKDAIQVDFEKLMRVCKE